MTDEEDTSRQDQPGRLKNVYLIAAGVGLLALGCGALAYYTLGGSGGSDDEIAVHERTDGCRCVLLGKQQAATICVCPDDTKTKAE
ncbi:hypothetical protein MTO96_037657, partial [Rhipicephalus appendiculatus]